MLLYFFLKIWNVFTCLTGSRPFTHFSSPFPWPNLFFFPSVYDLKQKTVVFYASLKAHTLKLTLQKLWIHDTVSVCVDKSKFREREKLGGECRFEYHTSLHLHLLMSHSLPNWYLCRINWRRGASRLCSNKTPPRNSSQHFMAYKTFSFVVLCFKSFTPTSAEPPRSDQPPHWPAGSHFTPPENKVRHVRDVSVSWSHLTEWFQGVNHIHTPNEKIGDVAEEKVASCECFPL